MKSRLGETRSSLEVRVADSSVDSQWNAFVERCAGASIYHLTVWRDIIEDVFGHETCFLWAVEGGNVAGILPSVRLRSRLFGDFMVSMPYVNYGGAVGLNAQVELALMNAAAERAAACGSSHAEFRDVRDRECGWPQRQDKVVMQLHLPASEEEVWKALGSKVRAQIRRPQREAATVLTGGVELLDDFYAVFARNMRDLGTPVYAKRFFAEILRRLPDNARIVSVQCRGQAVAGGLLLMFRDRVEIPWASSLRQYNSIGANMLLYWEALRIAIAGGFKVFDFGRSTAGSGTYRFKKQWGARPIQLHWHYWLRHGGQPPVMNPGNPKYRMAIGAWRRLPLSVANWLGPSIVRNLP